MQTCRRMTSSLTQTFSGDFWCVICFLGAKQTHFSVQLIISAVAPQPGCSEGAGCISKDSAASGQTIGAGLS